VARAQLAEIDRRLRLVEAVIAAAPDSGGALAALDRRVAALETQEARAGTPADLQPLDDKLTVLTAETGDLTKRLTAAEAAIKAQQAADQTATLAERILHLEDAAGRLATAQQADRRSLDGVTGVVIAVEPLRLALGRGGPFAADLAAIKPFLGDPAPDGYAALQALAGTGLPTLTELRRRWPDTVRAVMRAAGTHPDHDWWEKALARLQSLVVVRRIGAPAGDEADAVLARAESRLELNDLAGAVAELKALPPAPAAAARPWLDLADRRLAGDRALAALEAALLGRLTQR
jgi:hypothetical protein